MTGVVLDCSTTVAWALDESTGRNAGEIIAAHAGDGIFVPAIWRLEVGNALLQAERRGRHARADTKRALQILEGLPVSTTGDLSPESFDPAIDLARETGLTTYDASYLAMALVHRVPLATLDDRLARVARERGVEVL